MNENILSMDGLLRISLMDGHARAFLADTTRLCEEARRVHHTSRVATAALGRLLTGVSMMGSMLKSDTDSMTVMIKGSGPLGTLLAVAKPDAAVKGYVDVPDVEIERKPNGKLDVGAAVGRQGQLTVIKDLNLREPYVGRVNLVSGEIGEDLAMYFTASEQTPSMVSLGVLVKDQVLAAGGLIIQPMPECTDIEIKSIEASVSMFSNISGTILEYGLNGAVEQLLAHLDPVIIGSAHPKYACDCSRERVERALISLGREELLDMIREQHGAEVMCHFCNRRHAFTEAQLTELLEAAQAKS